MYDSLLVEKVKLKVLKRIKADTNIKENKKTRQINGLVNEWQIEEQSANVRRTVRNKKENGLFVSSNPPYRLFERYER